MYPAFGRESKAPSIWRLQEIASQIKGRPNPFTLSRTVSLSSKEAGNEADFKSCNGSVEREEGFKPSVVAIDMTEVWDRYQYAPPKRVDLLKPHLESDPFYKSEKLALTLRASKKAELLRSKRNRGESVASASYNTREDDAQPEV
jgi:hypothetical protein